MSATSEAAGGNAYVRADYGATSFFLDFPDCLGSFYFPFGEPRPPSATAGYAMAGPGSGLFIAQPLEACGAIVPVFDLDRCLCRLFGVEPGSFPVAVLARGAAASPQERTLLDAYLSAHSLAAPDGLIAFRLSRETALAALPPRAERPLPRSVRDRLCPAGVQGISFPDEGRVAYFIDPFKLLFHFLSSEE